MSIPRSSALATLLGDPALHRALLANVRRHVPATEAEDIVQATLTEALASASAPEDAAAQRRWVWGIARHKVVDFHRRARREKQGDVPDVEADAAPHDAAELLRWAEGELPEGEGAAETLEWLLREGDGDKLEHIAADENVPAARVRQRVSRLRKHFRARWAAQLAAVAAAIATVVVIAWWMLRSKREEPIVRESPSQLPVPPPAPTPTDEAQDLRRAALAKCERREWDACVTELDRARALDPAGDLAPEIVAARKAAADATKPAPPPSSVAPEPTTNATPKQKPTPTSMATSLPPPSTSSSGSFSDSTITPARAPTKASKPSPAKRADDFDDAKK